jgi:hypothetical protein
MSGINLSRHCRRRRQQQSMAGAALARRGAYVEDVAEVHLQPREPDRDLWVGDLEQHSARLLDADLPKEGDVHERTHLLPAPSCRSLHPLDGRLN